jgi:DnaK suppressor protein
VSDVEARLRAERAAAVEQIDALVRDFDHIVEASESVATDDEHDPEGHTWAWERQQVAALLRSARAHLGKLDDALARVEAGSYGTCDVCGGPIGHARLAALPASRRCVGCAP